MQIISLRIGARLSENNVQKLRLWLLFFFSTKYVRGIVMIVLRVRIMHVNNINFVDVRRYWQLADKFLN